MLSQGIKKRLLALLCSLVCCAAASQSASPQRIVSLLPSLTESVCALGACQRLVGVDRYSNWPSSVEKLPRLGGGLDVNIEALLRLKPDLVLLAKSARLSERLKQLGLKVLTLEPQTHEEMRTSLLILDEALGTQRGATLWVQMQSELDLALAELPPAWRGASVYFEIDRTPYAAGPNSFIGQTLTRLSLRNILDAQMGAFPKMNPEFVVKSQPQLIMVSQQYAKQLRQRPGWGQLYALQKGHVCELTREQSDLLVRSGPRLGQGARVLLDCLKKFR